MTNETEMQFQNPDAPNYDWQKDREWFNQRLANARIHNSELERKIVRLRAALVKSVEVIQTWHNQGIPVRECSKLWDIYWRNAPEMKPIREALSALKETQP